MIDDADRDSVMAEEPALKGARNDSSPASHATARNVVSAARNGDVSDHWPALPQRPDRRGSTKFADRAD